MLLLYFLITMFVLLTTLIQYKKLSSIYIWFGILSIASKAAFLQILITRNYLPNLSIDLGLMNAFKVTPTAFLLAFLFLAIFDELRNVQKRIALKIPVILFLCALLLEDKYFVFLDIGLIFIGFAMLFGKKEYLRPSFRSYISFGLFYITSCFLTRYFFLTEVGLFFELISFFFYYKVIQQLMAKFLIWKRLKHSQA